MTEKAKEFARDKAFDLKGEEEAFRTTFSLLAKELGADSFRRYQAAKSRFVGGFSISGFEAVALGVGYNYKKLTTSSADIVDKAKKVWAEAEFLENSGAGVRAATRIPKIVPFGRKFFAP